MQHKDTLIQEDSALTHMLAWKTFAMYGLYLLLIAYMGISTWFGYTTEIWLKEPVTVTVWGIERLMTVFSLFVLLGLIQTATKMLTRFRLEQNLRFDVYAAVCEVVSQALARHLPDYQKLTTVVAVGEELLKPAEQMSKRAARIQFALQQKMPGLGLGQAIDQIVRDALRASDISVTVANVETILTRIEQDPDGTVVAFERPSA